jgi:hypothetical protein
MAHLAGRAGGYPEYPRGAVEYLIESKTRDVAQC